MEKKHYLILDDEFIQYCKLNNIDDIEKRAKDVFTQGFNIIKYGNTPINKHISKRPEIQVKPEVSVPKIINKKDDLYD